MEDLNKASALMTGPEKWRYIPYDPPRALPKPVYTDEDYAVLRPRLALRLRGAQQSGYELANQVWEISSQVEETENRNREVIQKMAHEVFAVSHYLDDRVAEMAVKSYAPPGSRVMTEDLVYKSSSHVKNNLFKGLIINLNC